MTDGEKTGAMILAGGRSVRMGQDKARLPYGATTFLEHLVALVAPLVEDVVIVADTPEKYALAGARCVSDLFPDAGPVGGIVTGLTALGPGRHLVVACDMPAVRAETLALLLKLATPEWDAAVPEIGGRWEPLCAVYRDSALPPLRAFLETGQRAAQRALITDSLHVRRVEEAALRAIDPDLHGFLNLNTPDDFARFTAEHRPKP